MAWFGANFLSRQIFSSGSICDLECLWICMTWFATKFEAFELHYMLLLGFEFLGFLNCIIQFFLGCASEFYKTHRAYIKNIFNIWQKIKFCACEFFKLYQLSFNICSYWVFSSSWVLLSCVIKFFSLYHSSLIKFTECVQ